MKATKEISVTVIEKGIAPVIAQAEGITINDEKTKKEASEILTILNQHLDKVTAEKEKVTKPLNEALKAERARWKPIETWCETTIESLRRKLIDFQTKEKKRADEEAAKIASRVGEGKGKLKVETAVRQMEEIEKPESSVTTDGGLVKFKPVKKFEIVDVKAVPMEYHIIDEVAVRQAMRKGIELPGVRYYEEQVPSNFR